MKKSAACLLLLTLLALSVLATSAFGAETGNRRGVYIKEDGSIQGTDSIQRSGDTYTFTGNIVGALYVQRDNIVIDGAGYTLTGYDGRGVVLDNRTGVTIKNTHITLDGGYIVSLSNSRDCTVAGNTLVGTPRTMGKWTDLGPIAMDMLYSQNLTIQNNTISKFFYGLSLSLTSGCTLTDNTLIDGVLGIHISDASSCVFRNNRLDNCSFGVDGLYTYHYENDLDTSNTVNGKPIYYLVNAKDLSIPKDAANIVLVKCRNILIEGISPQGISLFYTDNTTVTNVNFPEPSDCLDVIGCQAINVANCNFDGGGIAIRIINSTNSRIVGNQISGHITKGIALSNADNTVIYANTFTNNSGAIGGYPDEASNCSITANTFKNNSIALDVGSNSTVNGNIFDSNIGAMSFTSSSGSRIYQNTILNNEMALIFSDASGNTIYLNNFINNQRLIVDRGVNVTNTYFFPPPPSINQFDNGTYGNYWNDYQGTDANGDGVADVAYRVYENNTDNYPLVKQAPIPAFAEPEAASTYQTPPDQSNENENPAAFPVEYFAIALAIMLVIPSGWLIYRKNHKKAAPQAS